MHIGGMTLRAVIEMQQRMQAGGLSPRLGGKPMIEDRCPYCGRHHPVTDHSRRCQYDTILADIEARYAHGQCTYSEHHEQKRQARAAFASDYGLVECCECGEMIPYDRLLDDPMNAACENCKAPDWIGEP